MRGGDYRTDYSDEHVDLAKEIFLYPGFPSATPHRMRHVRLHLTPDTDSRTPETLDPESRVCESLPRGLSADRHVCAHTTLAKRLAHGLAPHAVRFIVFR